MTHLCPHCRQPYEPKSDLLVDSSIGRIAYKDEMRQVAPQVAIVLRELARQPGQVVMHGRLIEAMYGHEHYPQWPDRVLKVIVCQARKKLEGWPFTIYPVPKRGYAMRGVQ